MRPEEMYQHLRDLAERLNIAVSEENLRKSGVNAQSGLCIVKNHKLLILDKTKSIFDKNAIMASFLSLEINEELYVVPAVREFIQECADRRS